jgi:hypothetical protein
MPSSMASAAIGRLKRPWTDTWNVRREHSSGPPGPAAAGVVGTPRTEIWGLWRGAARGRAPRRRARRRAPPGLLLPGGRGGPQAARRGGPPPAAREPVSGARLRFAPSHHNPPPHPHPINHPAPTCITPLNRSVSTSKGRVLRGTCTAMSALPSRTWGVGWGRARGGERLAPDATRRGVRAAGARARARRAAGGRDWRAPPRPGPQAGGRTGGAAAAASAPRRAPGRPAAKGGRSQSRRPRRGTRRASAPPPPGWSAAWCGPRRPRPACPRARAARAPPRTGRAPRPPPRAPPPRPTPWKEEAWCEGPFAPPGGASERLLGARCRAVAGVGGWGRERGVVGRIQAGRAG